MKDSNVGLQKSSIREFLPEVWRWACIDRLLEDKGGGTSLGSLTIVTSLPHGLRECPSIWWIFIALVQARGGVGLRAPSFRLVLTSLAVVIVRSEHCSTR